MIATVPPSDCFWQVVALRVLQYESAKILTFWSLTQEWHLELIGNYLPTLAPKNSGAILPVRSV